MSPRVTVLMSVFNDERYVGRAIESILGQTFPDFEFVIINDGSTDRSRDIILSYPDPRIRLVDNSQNIGLTRSLNRGLSIARGDLIARFDSNDISHTTRLERQVEFIIGHPDVAVLGTQSNFIVNNRTVSLPALRRPVTPAGIMWSFMFGSVINHPTAMYRRDVVWDRLHGYDETFTVAQDAELWFRVYLSHAVANLPNALVDIRVDPSSISGNQALPARSGHNERMTRLLHSAMRHVLQSTDVPAAWPTVWVEVNSAGSSLRAAEAAGFLDAIDAIFDRFSALHHGVSENPEIRFQVGVIKLRLAGWLATRDRIAAVRTYAHALRAEPRLALLDLPRYLALLLFGDLSRTAYRRWRQRGAGM